MQQIAYIPFMDADSGDQAFAIVRAQPGLVALGLSLQSDGDLEVVFGAEECKQLISALHEALNVCEAEANSGLGPY
jgi:hypothetical protein